MNGRSTRMFRYNSVQMGEKKTGFLAYAIPDEDLDLALLLVRDYVIPGRREVLLQALRD